MNPERTLSVGGPNPLYPLGARVRKPGHVIVPKRQRSYVRQYRTNTRRAKNDPTMQHGQSTPDKVSRFHYTLEL